MTILLRPGLKRLLTVARKQFLFTRSIQSRIFLSFSAVVLLAIATISWALYASFTATIEHNAKTYVTDSVLHANENFEMIFGDVEKIGTVVLVNKANYIGYLDSGKSSVPYESFVEQLEVEQFLSSLLAYKPYLTRVALIGANGKLAHAGGSMLFSTITQEPWFAEALDADGGRLLIDAPRAGDISYSRVIRHDNRAIGIVLVEFDKSFIQSLFSIKPTDSGLFFVTDAEGRPIVSADGAAVPPAYLQRIVGGPVPSSGDPDFPQLLASEKVKIAGADYLYLVHQSAQTKWLTVGFIPYRTLMSDALAIRAQIIRYALLLFVVVLLTSLALSRQITKGLQYLTRLMAKVREGNLKVRPRVASKDEIGDLSEGFHAMMSRIDELMVEVREREKQKREVEIAALQAQIRPHFIYNTLDMIKSLARLHNIRNVEELLEAFIELLRLTLGDTREFIPIREELQHLERYIFLQRYKYLDRFHVKYQVEQEVLDCLTSKLILQPIVENAIKYAFGNTGKDLLITIRVYAESNRIVFEITDNGIGMTEEQIRAALGSAADEPIGPGTEGTANARGGGGRGAFGGGGRSIGIRNVDERIKLLFDQPDGIQIVSEPGMYTSVEFAIPRLEGGV